MNPGRLAKRQACYYYTNLTTQEVNPGRLAERQACYHYTNLTTQKVNPGHLALRLDCYHYINLTTQEVYSQPLGLVINTLALNQFNHTNSHCRPGSFLRFNSWPIMYDMVGSLVSSGVLGPSTWVNFPLEPFDFIV